ncbi:MAG: restriction endonuclease subunit S [Eubacterium sp.]|nr:restriction endonuclease subunit S [Eubacterium sp.]
MDGLEVQEVLYSELEFSGRIDAEYYQKAYLVYEEAIHKCKNDRLFHLADFLIGPFGSAYDTSHYTDVPDFRYVRGQDVKPFVLKNTEARYVTEEDFNRLSRYALKAEDILISVVGTLGNACIVREKDIPAIFSCKSTVVRTKAVNPYFLIAYLNSKYGKNLLLRKERGVIQKGLNLDDLKMLDIPLFSNEFQNVCERLISEAWKLMDLSIDVYHEAEQLLINILGLENFNPQIEGYTIKSFKNSFGDTGRLDAEFYQSYYDEFEKKVKEKGFVIANEICSLINYGTVPTSPYTEDGLGIPYIKGMNLKNVEVQESNLDRITNTDGLSEKFYTKAGDIIISQMGTVADCGVVEETQEDWLFASFTIRLRLKNFKKFNPYFIGLYIQKLAKQYYFHRYIAQASVRQNTDLPTVNNLFIPTVDINIQNQIADKIKESKRKERASVILLKKAIDFVEVAIEQGESVALKLYT